ncbi:hypothetical protein AB9P05_16695 [Roseivirga sp. BDSF3-8]|uniref:HYC_CC_PP family protein n=1 Tax=Roseivirga sp. BDSF3-8 TaxID=3241598 RepID=UPI003531DFB9
MRKALSIVLAAVMLLMSQGMALGTHFCGGKAVLHQLMAGISAMDCGMSGMDRDCLDTDMEGQACLMAEGCCRDYFLSLEVNDAFKPVIHGSFTFELPVAVVVQEEPVYNLSVVLLRQPTAYSSPPSRGQPRLHIRYETFLI